MFIAATQNIPEDAISGLNLFYPCPPTGRSATMSHDSTDKRNQASIEATTATPRNGASKTCSRPDYWIGCWLFALAAMVAVMVMIGGATRLTESGLSMVRWRPLTGWLPPLDDEEWATVFNAYRRYPEYRQINMGMTPDEFKSIFWLEYIHRLWGRIIGLAFAVPFLFFWMRGWIRGIALARFGALFVLGGLQGVVGWYMVKSGLASQPDVSQYRLAAHLGFAFVIAGLLVWHGLTARVHGATGRETAPSRRSKWGMALVCFVFATVLSGALAAGLNAGLVYNTFPLMGGQLPPPDYLPLSPLWRNFFEDIPSVQFHHRVLAIVALVSTLAFCWRFRRQGRKFRLSLTCLAAAICLQAVLGVLALIFAVPLPLGVLHQAGALAVFLCLVWSLFSLRLKQK